MDVRAFWTTFRGTVYFRLLYLVLVSLLVALILPTGSLCLPLLLIPVVMLVIPYWFGERSIRRHATNGVIIIVLASVFFALFITPIVLGQEQLPQSASNERTSLADGLVDPFRPEDPGATFVFTVNLTSTDPDAPNFTVQVQMLDVDGVQAVLERIPMERDPAGDGDLANGETFRASRALPVRIHLGFNFQVLNATDDVVVQTAGNPGPYNASYGTYFVFELVQALIGMALIGIGFYLVLLLYWWTRRSRAAARPLGPRKRDEGGGEYTCTNCGADVGEGDATCPSCGASFGPEGGGAGADRP